VGRARPGPGPRGPGPAGPGPPGRNPWPGLPGPQPLVGQGVAGDTRGARITAAQAALRHLPAGTAPGDCPGAGRGGSAAAQYDPWPRGGPGHIGAWWTACQAGAGNQRTGAGKANPAPGRGSAGLGRGQEPEPGPDPGRLWPGSARTTPARPAGRCRPADPAGRPRAGRVPLAARVTPRRSGRSGAVVATGLGVAPCLAAPRLGAEPCWRGAGRVGVPRGRVCSGGEQVPGFGHFVYRGSDHGPSFCWPWSAARSRRHWPWWTPVAGYPAGLPEPISTSRWPCWPVRGMIRGRVRSSSRWRDRGLAAHALEEYTARTPLRPRAVYTGPAHRQAGPGRRE
jgi:hypothetical protein